MAGPTTFAAGAGNNITLNNANDFSTVSVVSGNTVTLNDVNALDLGASTISGALSVTTNGAITDSGNVTVVGPTTLAAGAGNNITLNNANDFSTVSVVSGNTVVLNESMRSISGLPPSAGRSPLPPTVRLPIAAI